MKTPLIKRPSQRLILSGLLLIASSFTFLTGCKDALQSPFGAPLTEKKGQLITFQVSVTAIASDNEEFSKLQFLIPGSETQSYVVPKQAITKESEQPVKPGEKKTIFTINPDFLKKYWETSPVCSDLSILKLYARFQIGANSFTYPVIEVSGTPLGGNFTPQQQDQCPNTNVDTISYSPFSNATCGGKTCTIVTIYAPKDFTKSP